MMGRQRVLAQVLGAEWRALRAGGRQFDSLPAGEPVGLEEEIACRPALYEEAQLGRVQCCGFGMSLAGEKAKLDATSFRSVPARRIALGEAVIAGAQVFSGPSRFFFAQGGIYPALRGRLREFGAAQLANTAQGMRYFGHWLRDDCVMRDLMAEGGAVLSMVRPHWPDAVAYERLFGQGWDEVSLAYVSDLTVWRELGFSRDKARRIRDLRARLRQGVVGHGAGRVVYIARGPGGAPRTMENEDALLAALDAAGVMILRPEGNAEALLNELLDASLVISIEGSQLTHAVFSLAEGGGVLTIQPPDRFYNPHHEWTRLMGMRYGIVVGQPGEGGFTVDAGEVLAMIDRLMAAREG
ncbi:MAG: glycosyltransferase 61 family protein [Tropicimonas sp.]|uniref:glycosyltransferase 61 family protein n=1 Tax=Tropicimonas sp. TaxID=2067044 RepID=UPI003A86DFCC